MWKLPLIVGVLCGALCGAPLAAQEKAFTLQAPDTLIESGLLRYMLPRFSLKTGIRITVSPDTGAATFGADGTPMFRDDTTVWHFAAEGGPHTDAFQDWLLSEVGKRTIDGFTADGASPFSSDVAVQTAAVAIERTGDAVLGETVSLALCGRCHVVNDSNRMNAIGSTPSFALMRNFGDWEGRFQTFFLLKPHPAFTQVADVTDPFPDNLPSPIAPIEVTLDEIDAIVAYVATIAPADLGAPVQSR